MPGYLVTNPKTGKRYRVSKPEASSRSPFDTPLARSGFMLGGQMIGGLAGSAVEPGGGTVLGGTGGALAGESLRQFLAAMTKGGPRSTRQQIEELGQTGLSAALGEAIPGTVGMVKRGVSRVAGFPVRKANEIREALSTYYTKHIRDYFRPLYESVTEKLKGAIPTGPLADNLGALLKRFNVIDESGSPLAEANLSPIQKKVLSIFQDLKGIRPTRGEGRDVIPIASLRESVAGQDPRNIGAFGTAMGSESAQTLRNYILKLHDMASEGMLSGRALADADHALATSAVGSISKELEPIAPELKGINAEYADRIGFFRDANTLFRPLSRSRLDIGEGEGLLRSYPGIEEGKKQVLSEIERRTGVSIHAPSLANAGERLVGKELLPIAGLLGGAAAGLPLRLGGRLGGMFGGYFLGRRLASIGKGLMQTAEGLSSQIGQASEQVLPGLSHAIKRFLLPLSSMEIRRMLNPGDEDEDASSMRRLLLHGAMS